MAQITTLLCSKLFNSSAFTQGNRQVPTRPTRPYNDAAPLCLHHPLLLPPPTLFLCSSHRPLCYPGTKPMPASGPGVWLFLGLQRLLRYLQNGISHFLPIKSRLSYHISGSPNLTTHSCLHLQSLSAHFRISFSYSTSSNILHNLLIT